jgi:predicted dehydrogenase
MFRRNFLSSAAALCASSLLPRTIGAALSDSKPLRVGVLGHTGRGNYGHGIDTLWNTLPQTRVVAVSDPDPKGLSNSQTRFQGAKTFADYSTMLGEIRPDIAAIAPRHIDQHHAMILAAIENGVRGIYIEKPFVRTPAEADEVVSRCEASGVRLAIAHRNRYHPALPLLSQMLEHGEFGTLLEIRARGKEDRRGGALDIWVLGSHVLNLGVFFAGQPLACSASIFTEGVPAAASDIHDGDEGVGPIVGDEIHARFETQRGIPLFFDSKKNAAEREAGFGLQIICTGGIVDLRIDAEPMIHIFKGNPFKPTTDSRAWTPLTSAGLGKPEPLANIRALVAGHQQPALDLITCIENGGNPLCGPLDGRTIVEMVHAVFASHLEKGARIPIPLAKRTHALAS